MGAEEGGQTEIEISMITVQENRIQSTQLGNDEESQTEGETSNGENYAGLPRKSLTDGRKQKKEEESNLFYVPSFYIWESSEKLKEIWVNKH